MTGPLSIRALPTAFDPPAGQVTVATPSCCCCCCCCLNATLGVTSFMASEAYYQAEEHARPTWLALLLGLLAVPFGIGAVALVGPLVVDSGWIFGAAVVVAATFAAGLAAAGVTVPRATGIAAAVTAIGIGAFFVEIFGALFTLFILELLCPLSAWGGWAIARSRHRRRSPEAVAWRGPEPAYPPLPARPPTPGAGWPPAGAPPDRGFPPPSAPPTAGPPPSTEEW